MFVRVSVPVRVAKVPDVGSVTVVVPLVVIVRLCAPERVNVFAAMVKGDGRTTVPVSVGDVESSVFIADKRNVTVSPFASFAVFETSVPITWSVRTGVVFG